MGIEEIALEIGIRGFPVDGKFFQPEAEGLPVDPGDHLQREKGKAKREPGEPALGEGMPLSADPADQGRPSVFAVVDVNLDFVPGHPDLEIEFGGQAGEGRDVKVLRRFQLEIPGAPG